jgi:uncharacterized protein YcbK (DUF882 family)
LSKRLASSGRGYVSAIRVLLVVLSVFVVRDAPARVLRVPRLCAETLLSQAAAPARVASWAEALPAIDVTSVRTRATTAVRLYKADGDIDEEARAQIERIASSDDAPHALAARLEQLVIGAAYHFNAARILVVSAFRAHAGRHGTGDAMDFKLKGVPPRALAAYLRGLPRAGVGIYTNPATQFVHLDVRDRSYHWVDASPPGVKGHEAQLGDAKADKRDAAWTPQMDLP